MSCKRGYTKQTLSESNRVQKLECVVVTGTKREDILKQKFTLLTLRHLYNRTEQNIAHIHVQVPAC